MLSYTIKSKINNTEYTSQLIFKDLLSSDENQGEIIKETKCWLCGNQIIGRIGELSEETNKYYIYFKCTKCNNSAEINVPKCSVKFIQHIDSINQTIQPITTNTDNEYELSVKQNSIIKEDISQNTRTHVLSETSNIKKEQTNITVPKPNTNRGKFISYKNQVLFHEPILNDPSSGNIHSTCCSNKCKQCGSRLTGKATRLDEYKVSLYWKCTKCDNHNDLIVSNDELD